MLVALGGTMGLGWAFDLPADLVAFGLLPMLVVSALLLTRLVQSVVGQGKYQEVVQQPLTEKA